MEEQCYETNENKSATPSSFQRATSVPSKVDVRQTKGTLSPSEQTQVQSNNQGGQFCASFADEPSSTSPTRSVGASAGGNKSRSIGNQSEDGQSFDNQPVELRSTTRVDNSSGYTRILDTQTSTRVDNSRMTSENTRLSQSSSGTTMIRVDSSSIVSRHLGFEQSNATIDSSIIDESRLDQSGNRTRMRAPTVAPAMLTPTSFAPNLTQLPSNPENPAHSDVNFSRPTPFPLLETSPLCRKASAPNPLARGQSDNRKLSSESTQSLTEQGNDAVSRKQDSLGHKNNGQDSLDHVTPKHDSLGRPVAHHYWKSSETLGRKNGNQEWKFPSVNYNYYHSKLNVLNAAEHLTAKYKTRRNSYDLIREKCLTILNMDGKRPGQRSSHEEAYQVSKIITIFDNVGKKSPYGKSGHHAGRNGSDITRRGKEKKEKSNEKLKQGEDKYGEKRDGKDKGGERIEMDRACKTEGRGTSRNEEQVGLASPKAVRKVAKESSEDQKTQTKSSEGTKMRPAPSRTKETYQLKSPSEHQKEVGDDAKAAKQADILSGRNGDRAKIEKVIENIRIQHAQMMEDMKRKMEEHEDIIREDKDIKTSETNMGKHHGGVKETRNQDEFGKKKSVKTKEEEGVKEMKRNQNEQRNDLSKLEMGKQSKNIIKTEATIEHTERNKDTNGSRQHERRTTTHLRNSSIDQTLNSQPFKHEASSEFNFVAQSNEKIVKMLDSSHFVITKESDCINRQTESVTKVSSSDKEETSGSNVSTLEQREQEISEQVRHKELMEKYQQYEIERSENEYVKRNENVKDKTNESEGQGLLTSQQTAAIRTSEMFLETQTTTNGKFPFLFEKIEEEIEAESKETIGSVDKNVRKFIETFGDRNDENVLRIKRNERSVNDPTRNLPSGGELDNSGPQTIITNKETKNENKTEHGRLSGETPSQSADYWQQHQQETLYETIRQQNQQLLQQAGIQAEKNLERTSTQNHPKQELVHQNGQKAQENQGPKQKQSLQQQQDQKQRIQQQQQQQQQQLDSQQVTEEQTIRVSEIPQEEIQQRVNEQDQQQQQLQGPIMQQPQPQQQEQPQQQQEQLQESSTEQIENQESGQDETMRPHYVQPRSIREDFASPR
uniref:Uncharacterized protein n=1 Tax=Cacopsylla melanoneura TaxID=428564 RepID=A0A8D9EKU5_9HEMI